MTGIMEFLEATSGIHTHINTQFFFIFLNSSEKLIQPFLIPPALPFPPPPKHIPLINSNSPKQILIKEKKNLPLSTYLKILPRFLMFYFHPFLSSSLFLFHFPSSGFFFPFWILQSNLIKYPLHNLFFGGEESVCI